MLVLVVSASFIANFTFTDHGLSEDDRKQALFRLAQLESDPALDYIDDFLLQK